MNSIDTLLRSWDQLASTSPKDIFLATRDGQLQFELKRARSFWEKIIIFFFGEWQNESFRVQVAKISALFESSKLQDKAKCKLLAERINSLGRYVFQKRTEKTFFICPKPQLAHFQIRTLDSPDTLIPPDLIKRGLANPTRKRCWLNASIKYFAATTFYDKLLTEKVFDPDLEPLRSALYRIVEGLRKNWSQLVIDALYQELIQAISKSPFHNYLSNQQDAENFIQQLENYFDTKNQRERIQYVKLYRSFDQNITKAGVAHTADKLQISPNAATRFDLQDTYMGESELPEVRDYCEGKKMVENGPAKLFYSHEKVTRYPDMFEVSIERARDFDVMDNNGFVTSAEIALQPNATVTLTEFAIQTKRFGNDDLPFKAKPAALATFRIIAAIERTGITSQGGHYIAHARSKDEITTHNDRELIKNQPPQVFATASTLILQLVERIAL